MKLIFIFLMISIASSFSRTEKVLMTLTNFDQDCRVDLYKNHQNISCLRVSNLSGSKIKIEKCVTNGCVDKCQVRNYFTRFEVHPDQYNSHGLYFSAWVGNGNDDFFEDYLKLKKTSFGFKVFVDRPWFLGRRDKVYCDHLTPPPLF